MKVGTAGKSADPVSNRFETGGILLGTWKDETVIIEQMIHISNQSHKKNEFVVSAENMNEYINRRDFVGLFHTHHILPFPGLRDYLTMTKLCRQTGVPLCLIIMKKHLTVWQFKPDLSLMRRCHAILPANYPQYLS